MTQMPNTVGNGLCTFRDKDEDTITFRGLAKARLGGPSDAKMDFVHGTGKYKGITGSGWYKATPVPSFKQGTFQVFGRFGGSYKILIIHFSMPGHLVPVSTLFPVSKISCSKYSRYHHLKMVIPFNGFSIFHKRQSLKYRKYNIDYACLIRNRKS